MTDVTSSRLDVEALLAPVSEEMPAGEDLRQDYSPQSLYYRLRDARAEARAAERQMDAGNEPVGAVPQWRTIQDLAAQALTARSKDLEIAAWYTEALLRSDGLAGLAAGCRLMTGLAERYWETLHPLPDEDGMATRVAPVAGLNGESGEGTLIQPLRKLPLFARPDGEPVALYQYEQSLELALIGDAKKRQARIAATKLLSPEDLEKAAKAAGAAHFSALRRAARAALAAWEGLGRTLDERAAPHGPPTSRVRDVLARIIEIAGKYAPADEPDPEPAAEAAGEAEAGEAEAAPADGPARPRRLETREEALAMLAELSAYFRRTEPHSPLAYTLEEAIRRARLTWPELLAEVVPDAASRAAILTTLGIRPPAP